MNTQQTAWILLATLVLSACGGAGGGSEEDDGEGGNADGLSTYSGPSHRVLAFNDLGMHCADLDYTNFAILPPYNVVNAQVIERAASPRLLTPGEVEVTYRAVADGDGSINSTSQSASGVDKGNFWSINPASGQRYVADIFGADLAPDSGLAGQAMPGAAAPFSANDPQPFGRYDSAASRFVADGIPIMPVDDAGREKPYPLMRVEARDGQGGVVAQLDTVLPVSAEADCQNCHALGEVGADPDLHPDLPLVFPDDITDPNSVLQAAKENILLLHDKKHATSLYDNRPLLCAGCHYSAALDLAGTGPNASQQGHVTMSAAMHGHHGELTDPGTGAPLFPDDGTLEETCYQCHPGQRTKCLRGAMGGAGIECKDCHGGMLAVGGRFPLLAGGSLDGSNDGKPRRPWLDEPRCGSCHTGDATDHTGAAIRLTQAWVDGDASASPRQPANTRFAEESGKLYRHSEGHGGVACEGCHGSTHAVWPNALAAANDNVAATQLQGHAGTVTECGTCHTSLPPTLGGPHGMHNVADNAWMDEHGDFYERNPNACRTCHGLNLEGTVLSRMAVARTLPADDDGNRTVQLAKGTPVSCTLCHGQPGSGGDDD